MSGAASTETLEQFVARTGVPAEEDSPNAVEWALQRLSSSQRRAIERMNERDADMASELRVANITLTSLWDFRRIERDCLAPLMIVTPEIYEHERCRFWSLTKFGRRVKAALAKVRAQ